MDTLEELKKQRAELDKKIEMLEYAEFPFKEGDVYWMIREDGNISEMTYCDNGFHKKIVMHGNAFSTQEEAKKEIDRRALLHRFKMFRDKCNGYWKPNWTDDDNKYYLKENSSGDGIDIIHNSWVNTLARFGYFKNEEEAYKAIGLFGDEIKRLYVEV